MAGRRGQRDADQALAAFTGRRPGASDGTQCGSLGLLVMRAAESEESDLPPLVAGLRGLWADLPNQALKRLAAAPYSLFDAGLAGASRWLEMRAAGVHELPQCVEPAYFDPADARSISRRMLVYGWHLARSRPRAACLVFGVTFPAVESLAACSLVALDSVAERHGDKLRPRWAHQQGFWREMLLAASAGADRRLHELLLGGVQRLAAETLAAHPSG